jgi:hypothetical protein
MAGARAAWGQTCAGAMSFNFAPLQVAGAAQVSAGGSAAAASVAAGTDRLFGGISTGMKFAELDRRVAHVALAVGTDQPLRVDNRLHGCPVVTVTYARGQDSAAVGFGGHLSLGWIARNAADVMIVPSARLGFSQMPDAAPAARPLEFVTEIQAAVGFILRGRLAVTPRVMLAWGQPATLAVELTFDAR